MKAIEIEVNQLSEELKERTGELDLRIDQLTGLAKELSEANEKLQTVLGYAYFLDLCRKTSLERKDSRPRKEVYDEGEAAHARNL